ncbi:unnamed protein product [Boreogadus saida]
MLAGWEEIFSLIGSFLQMARLHLQPPQTSRWETDTLLRDLKQECLQPRHHNISSSPEPGPLTQPNGLTGTDPFEPCKPSSSEWTLMDYHPMLL